MELTSPSFSPGSEIPIRHTHDGDDLAPPLRWTGVPDRAASLVLIVDDPDAPDPAAPQRPWVHWLLFDIPPAAAGLPEGGQPLPAGTHEGLNDWNRQGYGGPCPPAGRHRYCFKLYALDKGLPLICSPTRSSVEQAMQGHVLAQAECIGTYLKRPKQGP